MTDSTTHDLYTRAQLLDVTTAITLGAMVAKIPKGLKAGGVLPDSVTDILHACTSSFTSFVIRAYAPKYGTTEAAYLALRERLTESPRNLEVFVKVAARKLTHEEAAELLVQWEFEDYLLWAASRNN